MVPAWIALAWMAGLAWSAPDAAAITGGGDPWSAPLLGGDPVVDDLAAVGGLIAEIEVPAGSGQRDRVLVCSAVRVAPDAVLTAAHCVDEALMSAVLGAPVHLDAVRFSLDADLSRYALGGGMGDWPLASWDVLSATVHSGYDGAIEPGVGVNDDLAVLFLDTAVDAPLAYLADGPPSVGQLVEIAGYGADDAGARGVLRSATTSVAVVSAAELQVGSESTPRKCDGDSGGPTFATVDGPVTRRVVGIGSHVYDATGCEKGGVDTRVDAYRGWVDDALGWGCADGVRVWCDEPGLPTPPGAGEDTGGSWVAPVPEDTGTASGCGCSGVGGGAVGAWGWLALWGWVDGRRRRVKGGDASGLLWRRWGVKD